MTRTTAKGLGYPNPFYYDIVINPYASVLNGLADCTCYTYGAVKESGHRAIVSKVCNANVFHKYLINGWSYIPYEESKLEVDDVIEWVSHCHVAVYTGKGNISGSFYTGEHGRAYYNGKFDTRHFVSLEDMDAWMWANYPDRMFHNWSIVTESKWVGGAPEFILKHPLYSVEQNKSVNQICVLSDAMNVRNKDNEVLKRAESGYFNVLSIDKWELKGELYTWYEVEKGKYIAQVDGHVIYQEALQTDVAELKKENDELKSRIIILEDKFNRISDILKG